MSSDWQLHADLPMPRRRDYPIAIIGAGGIVNDAHLPAYRKAGFQVIGIFDLSPEKARATADRFGIPTVYSTLDALLAGPAAIVDVAVPAGQNPAIAARVAQSGKALLLQKPIAESLAEAQQIVRVTEEAGIVAAVNQQARWMPAARAMRDLVQRGLLGDVFQISFLLNVLTPWNLWPWLLQSERIEVLYHSIHYLDIIRAILGREPSLIFADGASVPGYGAQGETRTTIQLRFDGHLRATIMDNHHNLGGLSDQSAWFRVEGTEGTAVAELGLLKNYPLGMPDSFRYLSRRLQDDTWIAPKLEGSWFPDAFIGTMASVMRGLEGAHGAPETSVRDNLGTLRLVLAAYKSMAEHQVIDPAAL